jgi:hypothetical protein
LAMARLDFLTPGIYDARRGLLQKMREVVPD